MKVSSPDSHFPVCCSLSLLQFLCSSSSFFSLLLSFVSVYFFHSPHKRPLSVQLCILFESMLLPSFFAFAPRPRTLFFFKPLFLLLPVCYSFFSSHFIPPSIIFPLHSFLQHIFLSQLDLVRRNSSKVKSSRAAKIRRKRIGKIRENFKYWRNVC